MYVYDHGGRCEGHALIVRAVKISEKTKGCNKQFGHRATSNILQIE